MVKFPLVSDFHDLLTSGDLIYILCLFHSMEYSYDLIAVSCSAIFQCSIICFLKCICISPSVANIRTLFYVHFVLIRDDLTFGL